jgi:Flp pilus assembly pilin Flp
MRLLRDEAGATMVEYALIVGLIAVTCLFSMSVLGSNIKSVVGDAGTALSTSGN